MGDTTILCSGVLLDSIHPGQSSGTGTVTNRLVLLGERREAAVLTPIVDVIVDVDEEDA